MKLWRPEHLVFLILWLAFLVTGPSEFLRDPGTFWHIKTGEQVLAFGQPPRHDRFSFTFGGEKWQPFGWLAETMMAGLHSISGLDTVVLATATLLTGLFTWIFHRSIRTGAHWTLAVLMLLLLYPASEYHFHARPHLATLVLLPWLYTRLVDYEAGRIPLQRLWWLIPVFLLWVNLHGGALAGAATLGMILVTWWLMAWLGKTGPVAGRPRLVLAQLVLLAGCLLALLVNPYGWNIIHNAIRVSQSSVVNTYIYEHRPLDIVTYGAWAILALSTVYALALISAIRRRSFRGSWLAPIPWLVLGFLKVRHAPLFAVTATLAIIDIWPHTAAADWLARSGSWLHRPDGLQPDRSFKIGIIPALIVLAALLLQAIRIEVPVIGSGWTTLDENYWPVDLLPQLREYARDHPDAPIFNDMMFGGFLIYSTPGLPVFIDDRCELYGDRFILDYIEAERDPKSFDELSMIYGLQLAIIRPNSGLEEHLNQSPDWEEWNQTLSAVLFRRRMPKP